MGQEQRKISIPIRELFYSKRGNFFRESHPELQRFCLLAEEGDLLYAGCIWNFYTNEVSRQRGFYRELEFYRVYDKTLSKDLLDEIKKEEKFIFIHMIRGLDDSSVSKELLEKIYRINLDGIEIVPDTKVLPSYTSNQ